MLNEQKQQQEQLKAMAEKASSELPGKTIDRIRYEDMAFGLHGSILTIFFTDATFLVINLPYTDLLAGAPGSWMHFGKSEVIDQCQHQRVLHIEKPDASFGWGGFQECADCGKFINAWTEQNLTSEKRNPIRKIITKR